MRFPPLVCLVGGAALAGLVLLESPARACNCSQRGGALVWPRKDALVELDAALVLASFHLDRAQLTLEEEDGTPVELIERRRFDVGDDFDCSNASYAFLTPAVPLEPNTRYRVTIHYADTPEDIAQGQAPTGDSVESFVTGAALRSSALPELALHVFGSHSEHGLGNGSAQGQVLELYAETNSPESLFVMARGETALQIRDWDPDFSPEGPYRLSLGAVDCAEFTIVDVAGRTLASGSQCQPSKCAETDGWVLDDCGGEPASRHTWQDWQLLPDGCPGAAAASNPETTLVELSANDAKDTHGCGLSAPSWRGAWTSLLLCLAAALRRRRSAGSL